MQQDMGYRPLHAQRETSKPEPKLEGSEKLQQQTRSRTLSNAHTCWMHSDRSRISKSPEGSKKRVKITRSHALSTQHLYLNYVGVPPNTCEITTSSSYTVVRHDRHTTSEEREY